MGKRKKLWYIWFSTVAFLFLIVQSGWRIARWEYDMRTAWKLGEKLLYHAAFWGMLLPALVHVVLLYPIFGPTSERELGPSFANIFALVVHYLLYVFAAYRHVLWCEKHIAHYGEEHHIAQMLETLEEDEE